MDARLFCLVTDARGRYRISCRDADLDRVSPHEHMPSFDQAYTAMCKLNAYARELARARAASPRTQ